MRIENKTGRMICFQDNPTAKTWGIPIDGEEDYPTRIAERFIKLGCIEVTEKPKKKKETKKEDDSRHDSFSSNQ